jgi:hypothetical protein
MALIFYNKPFLFSIKMILKRHAVAPSLSLTLWLSLISLHWLRQRAHGACHAAPATAAAVRCQKTAGHNIVLAPKQEIELNGNRVSAHAAERSLHPNAPRFSRPRSSSQCTYCVEASPFSAGTDDMRKHWQQTKSPWGIERRSKLQRMCEIGSRNRGRQHAALENDTTGCRTRPRQRLGTGSQEHCSQFVCSHKFALMFPVSPYPTSNCGLHYEQDRTSVLSLLLGRP